MTARTPAFLKTSEFSLVGPAGRIVPQYMDDLVDSYAVRTVISVDEYGAVGDGVSDDTAFVSQALSNVPAGGAIRFTAPHTYLVNCLTIFSPMTIVIERGATVKLKSGSLGQNACFEVTSDHVSFTGQGTINANGLNNLSVVYGIEFFNANYFYVGGLEIIDGNSAMISLHGASYGVIENNFLHSQNASVWGVIANYSCSYNKVVKNLIFASGDGVQFVGTNGNSYFNEIANNTIISGRIGIETFNGCFYSSVANNVITGVKATGNTHSNTTVDSLSTTQGLSVGMAVNGSGIQANTTIAGVGASSITLSLAATATASGVSLTFCGVDGISLDHSSNSSVTGNVVAYAGSLYGIELADSQWCTVTGNTVDGGSISTIGIVLDGSGTFSNGATIASNTVLNCQSEHIVVQNAGTVSITSNFTNGAGIGIWANTPTAGLAITANNITTSGNNQVGILLTEAFDATVQGNIVKTSSGGSAHGMQLVASAGTTRDRILLVGNDCANVTGNPTSYTGSHFGANVTEILTSGRDDSLIYKNIGNSSAAQQIGWVSSAPNFAGFDVSIEMVKGGGVGASAYISETINSSTGWVPIQCIYNGATGSRPSSRPTGFVFFDTTLNKPVWWKGSGWVDATGSSA